MKRVAVFFLLSAVLAGCGSSGEGEIRCTSEYRAADAESGWSCAEVNQLGLWSCTCFGPGQVDTSVSDTICDAAKECH